MSFGTKSNPFQKEETKKVEEEKIEIKTNLESKELSAQELENQFSKFIDEAISTYPALKVLISCTVTFLHNSINIYTDNNFVHSKLESYKNNFNDISVKVLKSEVRFNFIQEDNFTRFKSCQDFVTLIDEVEEENENKNISKLNYMEIDESKLNPLEKFIVTKFNAKRIY